MFNVFADNLLQPKSRRNRQIFRKQEVPEELPMSTVQKEFNKEFEQHNEAKAFSFRKKNN